MIFLFVFCLFFPSIVTRSSFPYNSHAHFYHLSFRLYVCIGLKPQSLLSWFLIISKNVFDVNARL